MDRYNEVAQPRTTPSNNLSIVYRNFHGSKPLLIYGCLPRVNRGQRTTYMSKDLSDIYMGYFGPANEISSMTSGLEAFSL